MKRFISLCVAITMIMSLFSAKLIAEDTHMHGSVVFVPWSGTTSLPDMAGNYYLTADVQLETSWEAPLGEVNLCLDGHTISYDRGQFGSVRIYDGRALNVYDCSGIKSGVIKGNGDYSYSIYNAGTLTVNGGTISGDYCGISNFGTVAVNGGTIIGGHYGIDNTSGTLTVYSGVISGNNYGVYNRDTINVKGGTISSNDYGVYNMGTAVVNGGTVSGGYDSFLYDSNYGIFNRGTLTVNSGTIDSNCYGVYNSSGGTATVIGGTISGDHSGIYNASEGMTIIQGGSVDSTNTGISNNGALTVNGGAICGDERGIYNTCTSTVNGGNVYSDDYGIYSIGTTTNTAIVTVKGGTVSSGKIGIHIDSYAIQNLSGNAVISGVDASFELISYYRSDRSGQIAVTGKLENSEPYTVIARDYYDSTVIDLVFTNTEVINFEYNDPNKFVPAKDLEKQGYTIIKNINQQLELILEPSYSLKINGYFDYDAAYEELELLNAHRIQNGLQPLTMDAELLQTAMQRAAEIAIYYNGEHKRPDYTFCYTAYPDRLNFAYVGENILLGDNSAQGAIDTWKGSPGHNENMLSYNYNSVGLGCFIDSYGIRHWVQNFSSAAGIAESTKSRGLVKVTPEINVALGLLDIEISPVSVRLSEGKTTTVNIRQSILEAFATYVESADPDIATVKIGDDGRVLVAGVKEGSTTVKIGFLPAGTGSPKTYDITVTVALLGLGDINGDGKVDVQDGVLMQRILAKLETNPEYLARADLNNDNKQDVQDGVKMQRILAHLE